MNSKELKRTLALFYQSLKDYEIESGNAIKEDGRSPEAVVRLFMDVNDLNNENLMHNIPCNNFVLDATTSSATKCKCGREKWEHSETLCKK